MIPARTRKCKICRTPFLPRSMTHKACGPDCAATIAVTERERAERNALKIARASHTAAVEAMRPRKWWKAKAKKAMHAYIRARDHGKTCISCDTILIKTGRVGGDYDAGHFRPVALAKHLEFVEANISGQCKYCNDRLHGNVQAYEAGLIARHGVEYVEALKNDNEPRHLKIHDFQRIEAHYKALLKAHNEQFFTEAIAP